MIIFWTTLKLLLKKVKVKNMYRLFLNLHSEVVGVVGVNYSFKLAFSSIGLPA